MSTAEAEAMGRAVAELAVRGTLKITRNAGFYVRLNDVDYAAPDNQDLLMILRGLALQEQKKHGSGTLNPS